MSSLNTDNLNFTFPDKAKRFCYILMGIGALAIVYALVRGIPMQRFWANILLNSFFFTAVAAGALFFLALQYATESQYAVVIKRVVEGISGYLPIGALFLIFV